MKFDTPATTNPIDQLKVVGQPVDRIDGPLKTTGTARYAYEHHDVAPNAAFGYIVGAAIARGTIRSIEQSAAKAAPGVLGIVTAENAGQLGKGDFNTVKLLAGPDVDHYHQAIAVVVAETFEQARAAAQLLRVKYEPARGRYDLRIEKDKAIKPKPGFGGPPDSSVGDFATAFAAAPVQFDATYTTPDQTHAMMEPHASIAKWDGDKVTVWTSNQMIAWTVGDLSKTLGIPRENVRLLSPYIGGGFGGKLWLRADALHRRARRAPASPARESGVAAAADDEQHHAPARDDSAYPFWGDERRQAHRHRARELVRRPTGRRAGNRRQPDTFALRRPASAHRHAARGDGSPGRQRHARARRGSRHDGARGRGR
jgi:xanthine dehydrogenase YagR molybdenum-binding subunit